MTQLDKSEAIATILSELRAQYDRIAAAAREAHGYATDQDSKAEGKYDTRSLEASYLAEGQAAKAEELALAIRAFEDGAFPEFTGETPIDLGALVEVLFPDRTRSAFLLATRGGGVMTETGGTTVMVVTPEAPVFEKLLRKKTSDTVSDPEFTIVRVS